MAVGGHLRRRGPPHGSGAARRGWCHPVAPRAWRGAPTCVARTTVAIPWAASAQLAEALGCRAALELLGAVGDGGRRARVVGDNLAVIRYGAGTVGLRALPQQSILEGALAAVYARGWQLSWQAVRRRLNGEADRLATLGIRWAERCRAQGHGQLRQRTEWHPHRGAGRGGSCGCTLSGHGPQLARTGRGGTSAGSCCACPPGPFPSPSRGHWARPPRRGQLRLPPPREVRMRAAAPVASLGALGRRAARASARAPGGHTEQGVARAAARPLGGTNAQGPAVRSAEPGAAGASARPWRGAPLPSCFPFPRTPPPAPASPGGQAEQGATRATARPLGSASGQGPAARSA